MDSIGRSPIKSSGAYVDNVDVHEHTLPSQVFAMNRGKKNIPKMKGPLPPAPLLPRGLVDLTGHVMVSNVPARYESQVVARTSSSTACEHTKGACLPGHRSCMDLKSNEQIFVEPVNPFNETPSRTRSGVLLSDGEP